VNDQSPLTGSNLCLRYDARTVSEDLSLVVPDQSLTMIIGPNACGKSTLLRALARMLKPASGEVHLDGKLISSYGTKEVARRLGLLPQTSIAPSGITVADLVARGRYPHQGFLRQWSTDDEVAVQQAMERTHVQDLAKRPVDELSGGQRQRVWLAMALAQDTPVLLLDEPTTFLDIAHQIDILDLCAELHENGGRTLVVVLHELNLAARYATHLVVMRDGGIRAQGAPRDIVTSELVEETFDLRCRVLPDPDSGSPMVIPATRHSRRSAMDHDVAVPG